MTNEQKHKLVEDFLMTFPRESIKDLTLEKYANLNRLDSFCYWVEFKLNDIGSIRGNSAYKFGIYQYNSKPKQSNHNYLSDSKYAWKASLGETSEKAFSKIKDAILRIVDYAQELNLDEIDKINELAPMAKWKIAFLYSNNQIIPYYSVDRLKSIAKEMGMDNVSTATLADFQKFLKLKQGDLDIHEYGMKLHNLWTKLNRIQQDEDEEVYTNKKQYWWLVANPKIWDFKELKEGEIVDYKLYNDNGNKRRIFQNFLDAKEGDIVIGYEATPTQQIVALAEVAKENDGKSVWFRKTETLTKPIDYTSIRARSELADMEFLKNKQGSFFKIAEAEYNILIKLIRENNPISLKKMTNKYQKYIDLLKETKNLVLTGAPGTGKTFMAQAIAEEMGAEMKFVQFHPSYDYTDFVEGLRPVDNGNGQMGFERKDGVFKEFCKVAIKNIADSEKSVENLTKELSWQDKLEQFVEDAIENEKKFKTVNGSEFSIAYMKGHTIVVHNEQNEKTTDVAVNADEILDLLTQEVELKIVRDIRNHYGRKFGTQPDSYAFVIVKEIRAMKTKVSVATVDKVEKKPFVLIIDEINRGEASKIFGELFYAIDPGYRGKTNVLVQTQYQNLVPESDVFAKGFYVPENVYILATMNDIDRSVESMDFAMRRRFTWQEIKPEDTQEMLDSLTCAAKAKATMERLNKVIADTDGLGAAYMIGPSYFLKLQDYGDNFDKLWTMNIEPLLKEYLRGFRKASEIRQRFKDAFYKKEDVVEDASDWFDEEN